MINSALPPGDRPVLEPGSGGGFLWEILPRMITFEVFICTGIKVVMDGRDIPFVSANLDAIVMVDVLHHIPDPRRFFASAARCVR
ncbi:MAG: class I SAM-dependent methyltransferase [Anaerolineales bacterium]|nr:class I SAM-dependent methyltransferase [Anaerolineales bacterium]